MDNDCEHSLTTTGEDAWRWHRSLIKKARAGDADSAWILISVLVNALDKVDGQPPLFTYAADFFEALLEVRATCHPSPPSRADLSKALGAINILAGRGRPKIGGDEIAMRLAAEEQLRGEGVSAAMTRARLRLGPEKLGELRQRDLRTENPDIATFVSWLSDQELAALASGLLDDKKSRD